MLGGAEFDHTEEPVRAADFKPGFLSVAVFGPGHGEAVVVAMPDGRLGVIDACGEPSAAAGRQSPVLELLGALGSTRLLFACLTHPHRDHYGGFATMIERHLPEHMWWSGDSERKLHRHYLDYVKNLTGDWRSPGGQRSADLQRLVEVMAACIDRDVDSRSEPQHLQQRTHLLSYPTATVPILVRSLLPTTRAVIQAQQDAARSMETTGPVDGRKRPFDPNRISAALEIVWGRTSMVLGGDALCDDDAQCGWPSVVRGGVAPAQFVKIPHHASEGAHSVDLWKLLRPALAVATCVQHAANGRPPRPEGLEALLRTGARVVVTAHPDWWPREPRGIRHRGAPWAPAVKGRSAPGALEPHAVTAPDLSNPSNAVVVRFDDSGHIDGVRLHGGAREVVLAPGS